MAWKTLCRRYWGACDERVYERIQEGSEGEGAEGAEGSLGGGEDGGEDGEGVVECG